MIGMSLLHLLVLGIDALALLPQWLTGHLWTLEHWQPVMSQSPDMAANGAAFHATLGSFALPMLVFGALVLWMDRRGVVPPAFLGWGLGVWALLSGLVMEPSGYLLGLIPAVLLVLAARRRTPPGVSSSVSLATVLGYL
jgi:hypothetical protein